MANGQPVPYRYITGLPKRAQDEIERNFLALQTQIVSAPQRNRYYIACHDAAPDELAQADIKLDGTTDATVLNALTSTASSTHPNGMDIEFSSGNVQLLATWIIDHGVRAKGCTRSTTSGSFQQGTTISGSGASTNFLGGGASPCLLEVDTAPGLILENISFSMTGVTGATQKCAFFGGSSTASNQTFDHLYFDSSFNFIFLGSAAWPTTSAVFRHLYVSGSAITLVYPGNGPSGFTHCVFFDTLGISCNQATIFNSLLLYANPTSTTAINSNVILPGAGLPPIGAASGSLAGTYPAPTFAGRDSSVDQINRDMLPAMLVEGFGITTFPPVTGSSPTGTAGGSLAGSYPNPTFAGRDSSVDQINKDMLPTLLAIAQPGVPTGFPGESAGGALTGLYPNPQISTSAVDNVTITGGSGSPLQLVAGSVTNPFLAAISPGIIKGRALNALGSGQVQDLTASQVADILRSTADFTGMFMTMGG